LLWIKDAPIVELHLDEKSEEEMMKNIKEFIDQKINSMKRNLSLFLRSQRMLRV
jgi:hypothetical protein